MRFVMMMTALSAALAVTPATAQTQVLDFAQTDTCRDGPCVNDGRIIDSYGDTALVDVTFREIIDGEFAPARYWSTGYGALRDVVTAGFDTPTSRGQMTLFAIGDYEISLKSFDAGCYNASPTCRVFDYKLTTLNEEKSGSTTGLDYVSFATFDVNSGYSKGLVLNWGNGDFVGIDNIRFDIRPIALTPAPGAVPEPASWAMLIVGFGVVGGSLRRTRRRPLSLATA